MTKQRILISFAHPDDESFGLGGIIAKYVDQGADVYLICATNGDVGTSIDPSMLNGYSSQAELRLAELACANQVLGFKEMYLLGYKDSGMMGNESNDDPNCLWYARQNDPETLTRRVVEIIREVRPQVVITFNKYGGYGHPDHIAIQQATVEAFHLAGDPDYQTDNQPVYQPQKLYYSRFPTFLLRMRIWQMRLQGQNPRASGRNKDIDMVKILDNVEPAHTRVDITGYLQKWLEASACHESQGGKIGRNTWTQRIFRLINGTYQEFTRVVPTPLADRVDEHDLFEGVSLEEPEPVR